MIMSVIALALVLDCALCCAILSELAEGPAASDEAGPPQGDRANGTKEGAPRGDRVDVGSQDCHGNRRGRAGAVADETAGGTIARSTAAAAATAVVTSARRVDVCGCTEGIGKGIGLRFRLGDGQRGTKGARARGPRAAAVASGCVRFIRDSRMQAVVGHRRDSRVDVVGGHRRRDGRVDAVVGGRRRR